MKRNERRPRLAFFEDLGAENVGGHQVGRALDALVVEAENRAQSLDQSGLGETGDADQQRVAAAQQRDQGLLDYFALTKNDFADALTHQAEASAQGLDLGNEISGGSVDGCSGSQAERSLFKLYDGRKADPKLRLRQFLPGGDCLRREAAADRPRRP